MHFPQTKEANLTSDAGTGSKRQDDIRIPAGDDPEYDACVGTRLVANCTSGKFVNGARYLVISFSEILVLKDEATEKEIEAQVLSTCTCDGLQQGPGSDRGRLGDAPRVFEPKFQEVSPLCRPQSGYIGFERVRGDRLIYSCGKRR